MLVECTRTALRLWGCKATTDLPAVHDPSNHHPRALSPHRQDLAVDLLHQLVPRPWRVAHPPRGLEWVENEDEETNGLLESTPCFNSQQAQQTGVELALRFAAAVPTGVRPPTPHPLNRPGRRPPQACPRMAAALCPLNRDDRIFCQSEFPLLPGLMKDIPAVVMAVAEVICLMIRDPRHDEPCGIPQTPMNENETVIASASETVTVIGTVTAASENVSGIVTVIANANENENAAETTKAPRAVEVDEMSVHAKTTESETAEGTLSLREKYCAGQAAAKLVVGSVANETTELIWPPAVAMSTKAVFDPHRRPWGQPVLRPLRPCLPQAVDGSATANDRANETTVKAAAVAVEAAIASVVVPATMEAHMVKEVVDEVAVGCGWAARASDPDGACKHIFLTSPFLFVCFS